MCQKFLPLVQQNAFLVCSAHTLHSFGYIRFPDVQLILTSVLLFDIFQTNTVSLQSHNGKSGPKWFHEKKKKKVKNCIVI